MRKSKFSETKIAGILKELEAGLAVRELARKHGVSANTRRASPLQNANAGISATPYDLACVI